MPNFRDKLNELMEECDLTCKHVAKEVGVSVSAVSQWRTGDSDISVDNLFKLAKLFDCSLEYMEGRSDNFSCYAERSVPFVKRLREMLIERDESLYLLNRNGVIQKSTYNTWKKGATPRVSTVIPIADYFECSLDYLLGCN